MAGVAATSIRYRAASFVERTGWWVNSSRNCRWLVTTPSARARDAKRLLLIAQPPLLGEEGKRSIHNVRHRNSEPLYLGGEYSLFIDTIGCLILVAAPPRCAFCG